MAQSDIDLVLHLGDYIYEYPVGRYANPSALEELGRHVEPLGEILTLEDYRMRYGLYRTDVDCNWYTNNIHLFAFGMIMN